MSAQPSESVSNNEIDDLVHRYSDAVVHRNAEQWISTWADDATWDLGKGRMVEGADAILALWLKAIGGFHAVVQTMLNGAVTLDEEAGTGSGRWYVQESMRRSNGDNGIMLGHYDDRYVRTPEGWRFQSRSLDVHYQGPPDLSGTFTKGV